MTVDGAWQAMRPGSYAGAIILKVTPLKGVWRNRPWPAHAAGGRLIHTSVDILFWGGRVGRRGLPASYDTITTHLQ